MNPPFLHRLLCGALGAALVASALGDVPSALLPAAPDPLPAFPRGFDTFDPPGDLASPLAGTPVLAEWNRSGAPGDTIILTGSRLSSFTAASAGSDTAFTVFGQAGAKGVSAAATIQHLSGDRVAITLPAALPKAAAYLVWPRNSAGLGRPALLNAAEAWWLGPDLATGGDTFAVHGRNLTPSATAAQSWAYLQGGDGTVRWLTSRKANPYRAEFLIPDNAASGSYRVWVHNGNGAQLGWSGPLALTIDAGIVWTRTTFNVRDYGAKGNGTADDSAAIVNALAAAGASPGSTVYFPPGHYAISGTITNVPARVRWRGAAMSNTFIQPLAGFSAANYGLVFAAMYGVEMRDLTFDTLGRIAGSLGNNLLQVRGSSRLTLTRIRFSQVKDAPPAAGAPLDMHLCDHVVLRGCEFDATGGVFIGSSRQVVLDGCTFRGRNDVLAFLQVWGGSELAITGCSAADFDSRDPQRGDGWAQGRFLAGIGTWGSPRHLYFGHNRTRSLTARPALKDQNTGEQFLFEGLNTLIRGTPDSAGADWVQFNGFTDDYTGQVLVVVAGAGLGQSRRISAFDASTGRITVERPWVAAPDGTSTVMVGHYISRMAVYGNYFSGKPSAVTGTTQSASAGVEPFGGCVDFAVAHNTFQRLRYGISNWSVTNKFGANQVLEPNYFNEFLGNSFVGCRFGITNWLKHLEPGLPALDDIGLLGNVFRGNRFAGLSQPAFTYQISTGPPDVQMTVFDSNAGDRSPYVTSDNDAGLRDQVWIGNRFPGVRRSAAAEIKP